MGAVGMHKGYAMDILLVEDDPIAAEMAKKALEKRNIHVDVCASGEESLIQISPSYDFLLLDIELQGMNGLQVAEAIRKMNSQVSSIPIIALSSHTEAHIIKQAKQVGINGFLIKPLSENKCSMLLRDFKCQHH